MADDVIPVLQLDAADAPLQIGKSCPNLLEGHRLEVGRDDQFDDVGPRLASERTLGLGQCGAKGRHAVAPGRPGLGELMAGLSERHINRDIVAVEERRYLAVGLSASKQSGDDFPDRFGLP